MKSHANRSADYAHVLQTLISSAKLLQDATESSVESIASGPLLAVAVDRLEMLKTLKANRDVGEELAEKIVYQVSTIFHELSRPNAGEDMSRLIGESMTRYTAALTEAHDALTRLAQRGMLGKSVMRGRDRRELQGLTTAMDSEFNSFMEIVGKRSGTKKDFRRSMHAGLGGLPDHSGSIGRASSPSPSRNNPSPPRQTRCWPGTRVTILEEINLWATSLASSNSAITTTSPIYWLVDVPGSGKSAIAGDLADEWKEKGILGGYYDVSSSTPDHEDINGVEPLCQIWAEQLGSTFPELTSLIIRALSDVHRLPASSRGFQQQLKTPILQPVKHLQKENYGLSPQTKIIFVLDALDELPPSTRSSVIQTVKTVNATYGVKFLLVSKLSTSEEDVESMSELLDAPPTLVSRGNINIHSASNMADILLYLTAQFHIHSVQFNNHPQFRAALIEPTIKVLAKRSEGSILWTKLAFEMLLAGANPTKDLLNLLEEDSLSDINGLYLELLLQSQTKLDRINDVLAKELQNDKAPAVSEDTKDQSSALSPPGPSTPSQPSPIGHPTYPKNALATVLSAIGYSKENPSVWTLAELTGFGLQRTMTILRLLNTLIDSGEPPPSAPPPPPPNVPIPETRARSSSRLTSPSSFNPIPLKKRSLSNIRDSSTSASRKKTLHTDIPPARLSNVSPTAAGFSPTEKSMGTSPSIRSQSREREKEKSLDTPHSGTIPSFPPADLARATLVKIRHSTFRDWIRLNHPPTLLSCLTGRNVLEEDDLRFVVAPTKENGHAVLAKGCLTIIRGSTFAADEGAGSSIDGWGRSAQGHDNDGGIGDVAYACRYWATHCAELLDSLYSTESGHFMSSLSNPGGRWKALRNDMLQFFTRRLLWWADVVNAQSWIPEVTKGLEALRGAFQRISPEEDLKPVIEQLIQWTNESMRLLERRQETSIPILEEERNPDSSLVWKYYGDELVQRAALLQMRARETTQHLASEEMDDEPLPPPPALFDSSTPMSSPSRKSFSIRGKSPKAASSLAANSTGTGKAGSVSTEATSPPQSEIYKQDELSLDKRLPDVPASTTFDHTTIPAPEASTFPIDEHSNLKEQPYQSTSKPLPPSPGPSSSLNSENDPTPTETPTPAIQPKTNQGAPKTSEGARPPALTTGNIAPVSPFGSPSGSPTIAKFPTTQANSPTHNAAQLFPTLAMFSSGFANTVDTMGRSRIQPHRVEQAQSTIHDSSKTALMNEANTKSEPSEVAKEPSIEKTQTIPNETIKDAKPPSNRAPSSDEAAPTVEEAPGIGVTSVAEESKPLPLPPSLPTSSISPPTRRPPSPPSDSVSEPDNGPSSTNDNPPAANVAAILEKPMQPPKDTSLVTEEKGTLGNSDETPLPKKEIVTSPSHIANPPIALSPTETSVIILPTPPPKDTTKVAPLSTPPKGPSKRGEGSSSQSPPRATPIIAAPRLSSSIPKPSTSKASPWGPVYGSPTANAPSSLFPTLTLFSTNFGRSHGHAGPSSARGPPSPLLPTSPGPVSHPKNTSTANPHSTTRIEQSSPSAVTASSSPKAEAPPSEPSPSISGRASSPIEHDSTVADMVALINFDKSESPSLDLGVLDTRK